MGENIKDTDHEFRRTIISQTKVIKGLEKEINELKKEIEHFIQLNAGLRVEISDLRGFINHNARR